METPILAPIDIFAVTYDAAGNFYQIGNYRYMYDAENHLTKVRTKAAGGPGGPMGPMGGPQLWKTIAEFEYDALGRRIRAVHYDLLTTLPLSDILYYYDGDRVLAEYDYLTGTPVLLRYYIDGPTYVDEHILVHDAVAANEYYYLLKELYTVAGLADQTGNIAEAYNYDAYGRVALFDAAGQPIAASAVGNPYFFTGRRLDQFQANAPRLYHYRARSYDPLHGRFLQRDPAEYADGMNLYEYVDSRPAVAVDPLGFLKQGAILLPRIDGSSEIRVLADDTDRYVELWVNGQRKWRHEAKPNVSQEYPFNYQWVTTRKVGHVSLKTCVGTHRRDYWAKAEPYKEDRTRPAHAFIANLGGHFRRLVASGEYTRYPNFGHPKLWWSSNTAVWNNDILIYGKWYYSREAGEGTGYLYNDRSVFGSSHDVSESSKYRHVPLVLGRESGSSRGLLPLEEFGTVARLYHPSYAKWFTVGLHGPDGTKLHVTARLRIEASAGGAEAGESTFVFPLPGAPRSR